MSERETDIKRVQDAGRWPGILRDMTDAAEAGIRRAAPALSEHDTRHLACCAVCAIAEVAGGACFYLPKGDALKRVMRDMTIYAAHDGTTQGPNGVEALARRHRLSVVSVWKILKQERARRRLADPRGMNATRTGPNG